MSDLRGKDYLTEKEAAHYCGVCLRQFQVKRKEAGIRALLHMGKKLYRRSDLVKSIEQNA
ncbi:MAG: hypothetical protein ACPHAN_15430 [Pseudomonadales bacterium]|jgi:ribosomal protein L37AE/L43A